MKLKEVRKGFLTPPRMVSNVHANKLPARKSRNIARESMYVRVVNKYGCLEQLIKMPDPSSACDESVVYRRKNGKFTSQKQLEKSSSGTKLAEKGRKMILQERKEEVEVTKSATIAIDRSHVVLQNVQVEISEHLDLLNSNSNQQTDGQTTVQKLETV